MIIFCLSHSAGGPRKLCEYNYIGKSGRRVVKHTTHGGRDNKNRVLKHSIEKSQTDIKMSEN